MAQGVVSARVRETPASSRLDQQIDGELAGEEASPIAWVDPPSQPGPAGTEMPRHVQAAAPVTTRLAPRPVVPRVTMRELRASRPWLVIAGIGVVGIGLVAGLIALNSDRSESSTGPASAEAAAAPPSSAAPAGDAAPAQGGFSPTPADAQVNPGEPLARAGTVSSPAAVVPPHPSAGTTASRAARDTAAAGAPMPAAPAPTARNDDADPTPAPPVATATDTQPANDPPVPEPVATAPATPAPAESSISSPPGANVPAPTAVPPPTAVPTATTTVTRAVARQVSRTAPEYPNVLRASKVGGTVEVSFTIDATGRVTNARALSGPSPLRAAAEKAVRQWRYEPATLNGAAVESEASVQFTFNPTAPRPQ
ncbi:MAG: TonB family protein [Acidobacteria bacterium]|nr:TonB family protein [Acidobacteriota bacterium]